MGEENSGSDVAGIGKLAEAIPEESWKKIVNTATKTFTDLLAPITKTTKGLGMLIEARLDRMTEIEKIFSADAIQRAKDKIEKAGLEYNSRPNARVIIDSIKESSVENDDTLRDIWSNLIANELTKGNVHPEFPSILSKLSPRDARTLSEIAKKDAVRRIRELAPAMYKLFATVMADTALSALAFGKNKNSNQNSSIEYLERIGLIRSDDDGWTLTEFGREFVIAVTPPGEKQL